MEEERTCFKTVQMERNRGNGCNNLITKQDHKKKVNTAEFELGIQNTILCFPKKEIEYYIC